MPEIGEYFLPLIVMTCVLHLNSTLSLVKSVLRGLLCGFIYASICVELCACGGRQSKQPKAANAEATHRTSLQIRAGLTSFALSNSFYGLRMTRLI